METPEQTPQTSTRSPGVVAVPGISRVTADRIVEQVQDVGEAVFLQQLEDELLVHRGSCSTERCRLHHHHSGPCDIKGATPEAESADPEIILRERLDEQLDRFPVISVHYPSQTDEERASRVRRIEVLLRDPHVDSTRCTEPHLGLATTGHILDELRTRIEVHGPGLDYRTVDEPVAPKTP